MARNIARRRLTTKRRKRAWNLIHKAYEYETLCGMQVSLIIRNPENNHLQIYIPKNGILWVPSMDEIRNMEPPPRLVLAQEFEAMERNARLRLNPSQAQGESMSANGEAIALTPRLPEPPTFTPTQREGYVKEEAQEEMEVYIKEEDESEG
ncbi:hypothetical protein K432DRAFT_310460 [Lepidopterella palustris CBS 459.81]|uniref:MADS-box domain-containing protein n=1 Tax=Lepidopterella palustris CBS 459.81 TaxID=1314670 RepID=A0A8E2DZD4_9PEZI|nr:hypothetical protein K432DRAFT_310460 [Lepidopterella palustris CBS 459.81]